MRVAFVGDQTLYRWLCIDLTTGTSKGQNIKEANAVVGLLEELVSVLGIGKFVSCHGALLNKAELLDIKRSKHYTYFRRQPLNLNQNNS